MNSGDNHTERGAESRRLAAGNIVWQKVASRQGNVCRGHPLNTRPATPRRTPRRTSRLWPARRGSERPRCICPSNSPCRSGWHHAGQQSTSRIKPPCSRQRRPPSSRTARTARCQSPVGDQQRWRRARLDGRSSVLNAALGLVLPIPYRFLNGVPSRIPCPCGRHRKAAMQVPAAVVDPECGTPSSPAGRSVPGRTRWTLRAPARQTTRAR